MKTARKAGKKKPSRPRTLSLDRRLELLVERGEAAARQAEADLKLLLERDKIAARQSEADLKLLVERGKIAARQSEADRDRGGWKKRRMPIASCCWNAARRPPVKLKPTVTA